jgi:hypothetical protein
MSLSKEPGARTCNMRKSGVQLFAGMSGETCAGITDIRVNVSQSRSACA